MIVGRNGEVDRGSLAEVVLSSALIMIISRAYWSEQFVPWIDSVYDVADYIPVIFSIPYFELAWIVAYSLTATFACIGFPLLYSTSWRRAVAFSVVLYSVLFGLVDLWKIVDGFGLPRGGEEGAEDLLLKAIFIFFVVLVVPGSLGSVIVGLTYDSCRAGKPQSRNDVMATVGKCLALSALLLTGERLYHYGSNVSAVTQDTVWNLITFAVFVIGIGSYFVSSWKRRRRPG
jgi:hypothetical protein